MVDELEIIAGLKINKVRELAIREMQEQLAAKTSEMQRRGMVLSGAMESAKFTIHATTVEKECRATADIWLDLLTRKKGRLNREDINFIINKVETCARTRVPHVLAAMKHGVGASQPLVPQSHWTQQADVTIMGAAHKIRRDLEIHFRESEALPVAFPVTGANPQVPGTVHVNIQHASIANLNLGTQVGTINAALQVLSGEKHQQELANAIKQLTDAVLSDAHLQDGEKKETVEALSVIATEAEQGVGKPSVTTKALISWLPTALGLSVDLITLWDKFGPVIRAFFHL